MRILASTSAVMRREIRAPDRRPAKRSADRPLSARHPNPEKSAEPVPEAERLCKGRRVRGPYLSLSVTKPIE